jgi:hypothetical protein
VNEDAADNSKRYPRAQKVKNNNKEESGAGARARELKEKFNEEDELDDERQKFFQNT